VDATKNIRTCWSVLLHTRAKDAPELNKNKTTNKNKRKKPAGMVLAAQKYTL
jgi:hypothetical protein